MKFTEKKELIGFYNSRSGTNFQINYKESESIQAIELLLKTLNEIKKKYETLDLKFDMNIYHRRISVYWDRELTVAEKEILRVQRKKETSKVRQQYIRHIKTEAKKLKLI